jgi:preprotein translocase subunit SecF
MKFFELIPSGTHIEFIKNRWRFILISLFLVLVSLSALAYNQFAKGSMLNFGIDFAGGSQVRLAFSEDKAPDIGDVRQALVDLGYQSSSAVTVPDAEHEVLVRVREVVSIHEEEIAACEQAAAKVGDAELVAFSHPTEGSKIFLKFDRQPVYAEVERVLAEAGCEGKADKGFGKPDEFPVEVALIGVGAKLKEQFDERWGAGTVADILRSETVGAKVGNQLKIDGVVSLLYAIGFIFLFVMVRFDLRFAPGGIVALTHDAILVVGAFAMTGREFNLQTIAAVLTIIGYSINDTIVVFDRVRERVALHRDEPIEETTNRALNDTLSRTLLTTGTTLVVVLCVYLLGSGPIKDFAFALIIGLLVGTYSSLYIATPVFLWVNQKFYAGKGHLRWQKEDGEGRPGGPLLAAGRAEVDEVSGRTVGEMRDEKREAAAEAAAAADSEAPEKKKAARRRRRKRPQ